MHKRDVYNIPLLWHSVGSKGFKPRFGGYLCYQWNIIIKLKCGDHIIPYGIRGIREEKLNTRRTTLYIVECVILKDNVFTSRMRNGTEIRNVNAIHLIDDLVHIIDCGGHRIFDFIEIYDRVLWLIWLWYSNFYGHCDLTLRSFYLYTSVSINNNEYISSNK